MPDFNFEGLDFDPIAEADQAGEVGKSMAVPFARFYNHLKEERVDPATIQVLTLMYARKIWNLSE
jgi:hypothetical protein